MYRWPDHGIFNSTQCSFRCRICSEAVMANGGGSLVTKSCPTLGTPWIVGPSSKLLGPWDFPGKNTGVGCHFLLQGIFKTQRLKPCLLIACEVLLPLSHQRSPEAIAQIDPHSQNRPIYLKCWCI